jgi:phytoene dehydrogenase-like protein
VWGWKALPVPLLTAPMFSSQMDRAKELSTLAPCHVQRGGAYPRGGPSAVSAALVRCIEAYGGRVLTRAPVAAITTAPDGGISGVRLENGTTLDARLVISSAGMWRVHWLAVLAEPWRKDTPPTPPIARLRARPLQAT